MVRSYLISLYSGFTFRSISLLSGAMTTTTGNSGYGWQVRKYIPRDPTGPFPYSQFDMTPAEPGNDVSFYRVPRFVTHIDDNAIQNLRAYYAAVLPRRGRVLDFCSSWVSHYPPETEQAVKSGDLEVLGSGLNKSELGANPILKAWSVQNLNEDPDLKLPETSPAQKKPKFVAATCTVSIDYLVKPIEVLTSIRQQMEDGGSIHLAISNRCFPNKVVGRWLKIGEIERLEMVGDYLWWSGWQDIEIVQVVEGSWLKDPLWVVRGANPSPSS